MKKIFFALLAISMVFTSCVKIEPFPPAEESGLKGKLFINEVNGWPSADADKNFEIYNGTNEAISLENCYFVYGDGTEKWRGRGTDVIPAKGWFKIQGARSAYPGFAGGLSGRNPGVNLTFYDADDNIIDYYEKLADLTGTPLELMCHARIPDGGVWYYIPSTSSTPGTANPATPPTGSQLMPSMEKGLRIESVSVSSSAPSPGTAVTIEATVTDISGTPTVVLKWKKDDANQTDIVPTVNGSTYTATIPGQVVGTVVIWTVFASNSSGKTTQQSGTITWTEQTTDYTKLKLNEVSGVGTDDEKFYELINTGSEIINLAGCEIYYNANGATGGTLPTGEGTRTWLGAAGQEVAAGQLFSLIGRNKPGSFSTGLTAARILIITLKDPAGNVLDQCIRAEDTGPCSFTDKSFSRIPDGTGPFYFATPTPNVMNGTNTAGLTLVPTTQGPPPVDYTKLKINEVNGAPDQKWFEIYNTGTAAINLEGVKAYYSDSPTANYILTWTGLAAHNIPAGGYFSTRGIVLNTGLSANNADIRLQLRAPDGTTVLDTYEKLKDISSSSSYSDIKDKSHARIPNGTGAWYYTTNIGTPGASNGTSTTGYVKFGEEDGPPVVIDYTKLRLNEVNGVSGQKWVEIYNIGSVAIPLDGVTINYSNNAGSVFTVQYTFGSSEIISPNGFLSNSTALGSCSANNANVVITLKSPAGDVLDTYTKLINVNTGQGYDHLTDKAHARIPDGTGDWYYTTNGTGTRNATNGTSTIGYVKFGGEYYSNLVLNEIDGNSKAVELYNRGNATISLLGVTLWKNVATAPSGSAWWTGTAASGSITPGGYVLIYQTGQRPGGAADVPGFVGANGISAGQTLKFELLDPSNNSLGVFQRGPAPWGSSSGITSVAPNSFQRIPNGSGDWKQAAPTNGAVNAASGTDIPNM